MAGAAACRTFIGVSSAVGTVTGQDKLDVLIGPASVWIAAAIWIVHIDGRCRNGVAVDIDTECGSRRGIASAGSNHHDGCAAWADRFNNQCIVAADTNLGNLFIVADCLQRGAVGSDIDHTLTALVHNLAVDPVDGNGIAAGGWLADSYLEAGRFGRITSAGGCHFDRCCTGCLGADAQLEAVGGDIRHIGIGIGDADPAGIGVDRDIAGVSFVHCLIGNAAQLDAGRTTLFNDNVKRDGAAGITRPRGGDLDGRLTCFEAGHGDSALGGAVGHLGNRRIVGGHPQRTAVVVDRNNVGISDVEILVADIVQCDLFVIGGGTGARTGAASGRCRITLAGLDIQRPGIIVDAVAVAVQTVDLSVAVQLGRRIGVDIVDNGVAVIDNIAGGVGAQLVEI